MKNLKIYLWCIISTLLVGGLAALFTMGNMDIYSTINTPPLAPPAILFPIVWTILYILMGISVAIYIINKKKLPAIYVAQLIVNFIWPIAFFNLRAFAFSFIIILLLITLVILMILKFYKVNKFSGLLQIPYLIWLLFAAYLNYAIYLLN